MAELALGMYLVYLGLAFGLRSVLQRRATGSTGFVGISGSPGSPEWSAGVLFVVALFLGLMAPAFAVAGIVEPFVDSTALNVVGLAATILGIGLTLHAQGAMGSAWRIGVDADERTELVMGGPFAVVRNPIFSAMVPAAAGLALMVPSVISVLAVVSLFAAVELQVRIVEEPYLMRIHGSAYRAYAARVGRFVPRVGRISNPTSGREDRAIPS